MPPFVANENFVIILVHIIENFLAHCSWVLQNGCDGINILGSIGEATSFNLAQRKIIMKSAAQELDKKYWKNSTELCSKDENYCRESSCL